MQGKYKIIGGEFEVAIDNLQYPQRTDARLEGIYQYASGRSALYHILLDIQSRYGIQKLLLPDYLCSSVVVAAEKAGMKVIFYPMNDNLELDKRQFANLYSEKWSVLMINYFGLQNLKNQIAYVRSLNKNAVIIEDDVQGFYEFQKALDGVDYKFTSLRKTFACPDGGLVKTNYLLSKPKTINKFHQYKMAGSILKSHRPSGYYDDEVYLMMLEKGEAMIDDEISEGMSPIAGDIMLKTDIDSIASIRRSNAKYLSDGLRSLGLQPLLPITTDKTPLFVPIYLENRDHVRQYMFRYNCFCPVHWPTEGLIVKKGEEMAKHELSLIVDQRYNNTDMEFILDLIAKSKS